MICTACREAKRSKQGSSVPGFCDACGWALRDDGAALRPAKSQVVVGQAMFAKADNLGNDPWEWLRNEAAAKK